MKLSKHAQYMWEYERVVDRFAAPPNNTYRDTPSSPSRIQYNVSGDSLCPKSDENSNPSAYARETWRLHCILHVFLTWNPYAREYIARRLGQTGVCPLLDRHIPEDEQCKDSQCCIPLIYSARVLWIGQVSSQIFSTRRRQR